MNIKLAVAQHQGYADKTQALHKSQSLIEQAAANNADIILLPELHATLYFPQTENADYFDYAEPINGPTVIELQALAKKHAIIIVSSIFERRAPGLYHNTAVVIENTGEVAGIYRKMHIPDDPGFYEKYYFAPGDLGFTPIQTSVGKLGVLVCWDQWFPEAARIMALKGASMLLYPTAIGWEPEASQALKHRELNAWLSIQQSHAIANHLPVAACNRVGLEKPAAPTHAAGISFWGNSFICGPAGNILAQACSDNTELLISDLDLSETETLRQTWPYLRDRRTDAYQSLLKRFDDAYP